MSVSFGVAEVRTTGDDLNAGGLSALAPGGQFNSDLAATEADTSSPVVTSANYAFQATDVGKWLYINAGTNWTPGWYKVASVSGGSATLNAGIGQAVLKDSIQVYLGAATYNTVAGCATIPSPTIGTWAMDYSQQDLAEWSGSDLMVGSSNVRVRPAGRAVQNADRCNLVYIQAIYTPIAANTAIVVVTGGGSTGGSLAAGVYRLNYTFVGNDGRESNTTTATEVASFTVAAGNIPRVWLPPLPPGVASINIYLTLAGGASASERLYASGVTTGTYDLAIAHPNGVAYPTTFPNGWVGGLYEIVGTNNNAGTLEWVLDRSPGQLGLTGATARMGGALATPGRAVQLNVGWAFIRSGVYPVGAGLPNTPGNTVNTQFGSSTIVLRGYETARWDSGAKPILRLSAAINANVVTGILVSGSNSHGQRLLNIRVEANGFTVANGVSVGSGRSYSVDCESVGAFTTAAFSGTQAISCYAEGAALGFQSGLYCVAKGCTLGFNNATHCVAYGGSVGFSNGPGSTVYCVHCVAYGNSSHGFSDNANNLRLFGCLSVGNTGKGYALPSIQARLENCYHYGNAGGTDGGTLLPADPFTNALIQDFTLSPATTLIKNLARAYPVIPTTSYEDAGAAQHQDSGGTSTPVTRAY